MHRVTMTNETEYRAKIRKDRFLFLDWLGTLYTKTNPEQHKTC